MGVRRCRSSLLSAAVEWKRTQHKNRLNLHDGLFECFSWIQFFLCYNTKFCISSLLALNIYILLLSFLVRTLLGELNWRKVTK